MANDNSFVLIQGELLNEIHYVDDFNNIIAVLHYTDDPYDYAIRIQKFFVNKEYREKHIGKKTMHYFINLMKRTSIRSEIHADITPFNPFCIEVPLNKLVIIYRSYGFIIKDENIDTEDNSAFGVYYLKTVSNNPAYLLRAIYLLLNTQKTELKLL